VRRFLSASLTAIVLAGAAACSKGASSTAETASSSSPPAYSKAPASANDGARVYITNCSSCHQLDGRGVPGAFPPLAGNPVVTGDPHRTIAIVKLGMSGKIAVAGETYDGTMPRWDQLISDEDIAAVVTYIRSAWKNRAGAVSVADVQAVSR
jgi:mono/diheme cytochrome c family protein